MTNSSISNWGRIARWLHWGMAAAIVVEVPAGYLMAYTYGPLGRPNETLHVSAAQLHHTLGLLVLAALLIRVGWGISHPRPPLPATVSKLEARLSALVQFMLYSLLLLIPLSGWAALSSLADIPGFGPTQMWFFGHDGFGPGGLIPRLVPPVPYDSDEMLRYSLFGTAHRWMIYSGGVLLTLHIAAALRHHFLRKDNVLRAMIGKAGQ